MKRYQNFVAGQLVDALSGESETIASPASEQAIATVPKAGAADVDRAVAAADQAFLGGEFVGALLVEEVDDALHLRHHFGADAVAGEQQEIVGCHFLRLA